MGSVKNMNGGVGVMPPLDSSPPLAEPSQRKLQAKSVGRVVDEIAGTGGGPGFILTTLTAWDGQGKVEGLEEIQELVSCSEI